MARLLAVIVLLHGVHLSTPAAPPPAAPPDLTQSPTVDRKLTYNLGATGLRGWIYTRAADFLDSVQGRTTTASRQILVTHVGARSPADGMVKVDDVILGVGGKPFSDDARKSLALAIQEAEKETGILKLTLWRAGRTLDVQLKLRVLGSYVQTAPFNCPKSKKIFEDACAALEKEPLKTDIWGAVNGLALMASGKPEYLPRVRDLAHKMAPQDLKLEHRSGMVVWDWGYRNLFLCEYYLLTGDKQVLHAINQYTIALAKGQSMYGTFGHGISMRTPEGNLHGSIPPYGPVNAAGLVGNIAIVMGKKCGVQDPEIEPAIERAAKFFAYFVDKGAIPYGEHAPWPYHENNGKNSMAAVMYGVQGNPCTAAKFFARMSTAGYANREYGHTGQGFSYLWGALGAHVGGPAAVAAFFGQSSWHFDLVRRCDGSFTYDGGEQYGAGKTDDDTYYGQSGYYGLSPNATYVLTYSLPLRKLYITGRDSNQSNWLTRQELVETIASGRFDIDRKAMSPAQLIKALGDWSPVVRGWAAEELAKRPEARSMAAELIVMAEGGDARARQGACEALGQIKSAEALPVLARLLTHEDRWLRVKASNALKNLRDAARPAIPDMLKAAARNAEPLQPIEWADPVQISQTELATALFRGLVRDPKGIDSALLYPAIRAIANAPDGMARATLRDLFENKLSAEDVQALAPDILAAIKTRCPADTMFGNEIRMGGFKALTKYRYKEAIEAGILFAMTQGGHGSENRTGEIMKQLVTYGAAARQSVPQLRELIDALNEQCKRGEFPAGELNNRRVNAVEEAIKAIESSTTQPELRSITP